MGCCLPALVLGEITPRGDLYRPSHPHYSKRRQKYPFDPYRWQTGRVGLGQDCWSNRLEEVVDVRFGRDDFQRHSFVNRCRFH